MDKWLADYLSKDPPLSCDTLSSSEDLPSSAILVGITWLIWKARNASVFQQRKPNPWNIVEEAISDYKVFERWNTNKKAGTQQVKILVDRWSSPAKGNLKLNVDAAWCSET
ncbi:hypothetical protein NL676_012545 [Syzygium grande]|nr:hypothetical protein NL676_012545 [Syzygium grande]